MNAARRQLGINFLRTAVQILGLDEVLRLLNGETEANV